MNMMSLSLCFPSCVCLYFKAAMFAEDKFAETDLTCDPLFFTLVCALGASDKQISS